ncbi:MAG: uroporphyrinogen decarboxylase family protein [Thermoproteota archaeon]
MDPGERVRAVLAGELPDKIPWIIYSNHLQRGTFERKLRRMGLGLDVRCSVYKTSMPNVRIESRKEGECIYTTYHTPVGKVSSKTRTGLKFQFTGGSAIVGYLVKEPRDVKVLEFIIEDTIYEPYYENYSQLEEELGGDGVVVVGSDYTPLMKIIIRYMGFRTFALMQARNQELISELVSLIDRKYEEMYKIIADSPAKIVNVGDNIDSVFVSPKLFENYCLPYYNKYCDILKGRGKIVMSHMDGRLRVLKDLIARTKLDVIEAFTPPPMGDLPLKEAKESWKDKVIWINFPEEVFLRSADEIRKFTLNLLEEIAPGRGFIIGITEDIHPDHFKKGMSIITETLHKYGDLPLKVPLMSSSISGE